MRGDKSIEDTVGRRGEDKRRQRMRENGVKLRAVAYATPYTSNAFILDMPVERQLYGDSNILVRDRTIHETCVPGSPRWRYFDRWSLQVGDNGKVLRTPTQGSATVRR